MTSEARLGLIALLLGMWFATGCSLRSGGKRSEGPPPPAEDSVADTKNVGADEILTAEENDLELVHSELEATRAELDEHKREVERLQTELRAKSSELMALEESSASLELELASALEELLRTQASLRNVQSRAFAVSRIAEVRAELESFRNSRDPALRDRLNRADDFLARADAALADENVGGAAYMADRAGELLRQARTISELRRKQPSEVIPIVPPRSLEVQTAANLRSEPSAESKRVGGVSVGTRLRALARQGDWYRVQVQPGMEAWIHRALVR